MGLSYQDVLDILRSIERSDCQELILDLGDTRLIIQKRGAVGDPPVLGGHPTRGSVPTPVVAAPPASNLGVPAAGRQTLVIETPTDHLVPVRAPMVGRFYGAPSPGAQSFVHVGRVVEADDTVCIIEVMKLMTQIRAGVRGRVVSILVENAQMVEYGQPLILIEPVEQLVSLKGTLAGVSPSE